MGKLYILPNFLSENGTIDDSFPRNVGNAIQQIQGLIAESEKNARRYLRKFLSHEAMAAMPLQVLNEHNQATNAMLEPMKRGETWGLISDAGLSCIADPGSDLVWLAHQNGVEVETFIGPSSIIMALQLSGMNGQQFSFHGYLPREPDPLKQKVHQLESQRGTQIFIEAPYRSQKILDFLLKTLQPQTKLAVVVQLTHQDQRVFSLKVKDLKKKDVRLGKEPAVFLIEGSKS